MRMSNHFTDTTNVYDGCNPSIKLGMIVFKEKGKPVTNNYDMSRMKYVDGFVFEPTPNLEIKCNLYKHIARYVYDLNEQFKEYTKIKQRGGNCE